MLTTLLSSSLRLISRQVSLNHSGMGGTKSKATSNKLIVSVNTHNAIVHLLSCSATAPDIFPGSRGYWVGWGESEGKK